MMLAGTGKPHSTEIITYPFLCSLPKHALPFSAVAAQTGLSWDHSQINLR